MTKESGLVDGFAGGGGSAEECLKVVENDHVGCEEWTDLGIV